ncbi:unnamed protein product [Arctogadus glacialis]
MVGVRESVSYHQEATPPSAPRASAGFLAAPVGRIAAGSGLTEHMSQEHDTPLRIKTTTPPIDPPPVNCVLLPPCGEREATVQRPEDRRPGADAQGPTPRGRRPGADAQGPTPRGRRPGADAQGPTPRGRRPGADAQGPTPRGRRPEDRRPGADAQGPTPRGRRPEDRRPGADARSAAGASAKGAGSRGTWEGTRKRDSHVKKLLGEMIPAGFEPRASG